MRRIIVRNIAAITAVFILTMGVMLAFNYVQLRSGKSLQVEILEQLKLEAESDAANVELQQQIRQLDLMARKAYFTGYTHIKVGIIIVIAMSIILFVSLFLYYKDLKQVPEKEVDPIDDWAMKTASRRAIRWIGVAMVGVVGVLAIINGIELSPTPPNDHLLTATEEPEEVAMEMPAPDTISVADTSTAPAIDTVAAAVPKESIEISKVTHHSFRGNNGNGTSAAKGIPTQWNLATGDNILWKVKLTQKGFNSPVISGNNVFITVADEKERLLLCYELSSGKLRWSARADKIAGSPTQPPKTQADTGLAASTCSTNGSEVMAIFATGDLLCTDMEGNRLWAKNLGVPDNHYGYASSLLVHGNTVFVQWDNDDTRQLMALNTKNGAVRWNKPRTLKTSWSSPSMAFVNGKPQLILNGVPNVTAYDPTSGEQLWTVKGMDGEVCTAPCSAGGRVFAASENATALCIDATNGTVLWENSEYLPEIASPVATKKHLFVATSYGVVACYDAEKGELLKEVDLKCEFHSSPVLVEGKIYLFDTNGKLYVIRPDESLTVIATVGTGEKTFATPAFTDHKIVVRTNQTLYCATSKTAAQ